MKQLKSIEARSAAKLCDLVNDQGIEPISIVGSRLGFAAFYYDKPDKKAKGSEPHQEKKKD